MKESSVNAEIVKSIKVRHPESWVYKIPDTPGPHMSPKPFDIIWIHGYSHLTVIAIETKLFKSYRSLSMADLRPSQVKGLSDFEYGFHRISHVAAVYRFFNKERKRISELYLIPYDMLREKESIPYKDLKDYSSIKLKKGVWQI